MANDVPNFMSMSEEEARDFLPWLERKLTQYGLADLLPEGILPTLVASPEGIESLVADVVQQSGKVSAAYRLLEQQLRTSQVSGDGPIGIVYQDATGEQFAQRLSPDELAAVAAEYDRSLHAIEQNLQGITLRSPRFEINTETVDLSGIDPERPSPGGGTSRGY